MPSGSYRLRAWRGRQTFAADLTVAAGQALHVTGAELLPVPAELAFSKGAAELGTVAASAASARGGQGQNPWALAVGLGLMDGAAKDALLAGVHLAVQRQIGTMRVDVALRAGTGRATAMRENRVMAEILPSVCTSVGWFRAGIGLGLGGGIGIEQVDGGRTHWSGLAYASPTLLCAARLGERYAVQVGAGLPLTLLRRDDRMTVTALGAVWLGLSRGL